MKIVLLTSDSLRHKYIAASVAENLKLALIVTEKKSARIQDASAYGKKDAEFLAAHFRERAASEQTFFGEYEFPKEVPRINVPHGRINSEDVFEIIQKTAPDLILLFGTSIITDPLLSQYEGKIINLHLGLSPYYKGSATNLYPYLFEEPECIGATIHLATKNVDEGNILYQFRPDIEEADDLHRIGNKVIQKAGKILPTILRNYQSGGIKPIPQKGSGRLTRNKDVTPYVLREIYQNFKEGMIIRYLRTKESRDSKRPIVQ